MYIVTKFSSPISHQEHLVKPNILVRALSVPEISEIQDLLPFFAVSSVSYPEGT